MSLSDPIKKELSTRKATFTKSFNDHNFQGMAECYSSDGILMAPGAPAGPAKQAVLGAAEMLYGMGWRNFTIKVEELKPCDSRSPPQMILDRGLWTMTNGQGEVMEGKYIQLHKQEAGAWLCCYDIFNMNAPPKH